MIQLDSRYRAVLKTYWQRPAFRAMAIVGAIDVIILVLMGYLDSLSFSIQNTPLFVNAIVEILEVLAMLSSYMLFVAFAAMMMQQLREQLNNSGAGVMPQFRRPHLVVAFGALVLVPALISTIVTIAMQILIGHEGHTFRLLGVFSIMLGAMTITAWFAAIRSPWFSLLVLPVFMLLGTWEKFSMLMGDIADRPYHQSALDPRAVILLLLDLAMLAVLFRWLARERDHTTGIFRKRRRAVVGTANQIPIPSKPHHPVQTPLSRAWHRRQGFLSPLAPWMVAATLSAVLICITLIVRTSADDLQRSLLLPTLVPGVVISLIWRERWQNLGYESLYPAPRGDFIQELLTATGITLVELWLATTLAVLPPILMHHPKLLADPMFQVTLVASAAMQFLVFGVMFLSALFRPILPYINVITILAQVLPIGYAWSENKELSPRGLLVVAGMEMLIGIAITLIGYATWRRADLA